MSDDWKWRDADWNHPSQPGSSDPSFFNQPTYTPPWDSETLGASEGTIGPPPPPPPGSEAAYSWQNPSTPSPAAFDGLSAYDGPVYKPYSPPPYSPPPFAPAPVGRATPSWALLFGRGCLVLFIVLLVLGGLGTAAYFLVVVPASHTLTGITSNPGTHTDAQTRIPVSAQPKIVIDRNSGDVRVSVGQDGKVTILATDNTFGGEITYQKSENVIIFDLDDVEISTVDLTVPPLTDLDITTNSGDIMVDGVSGQISLSTNGSSITTTHVTLMGDSKIDVNAGDITFDGALDPASTDDFENNDGIIGLTFPANGSFHVEASANGDSIVSDFPEIAVSYGEAEGDVGDAPRAQVTVSTNAGSIHLYKGPAGG